MWRSAKPEEDDLIVAMCMDLNREDPGPRPVLEAQVQRTLSALRKDPVRGRAMVLELDERVQGYAFLISFWSNELGGEILYIDEVYVKPGFRSRGYASGLIQDLIAKKVILNEMPVAIDLEVTPRNTKARALYTRLGFAPAKNTFMRLRF